MSGSTGGRAAAARRLLEGHHSADPAEAAHLDAALRLLREAGEPFDRDCYAPGHLTASAFVLHPSAVSVALVEHVKLGKWVQPGGHVEPGDSGLEAAARREVAEEVGIADLEPLGLLDVDLHSFPARAGAPSHLHVDVRFAFRAAFPRLTAGEEVARVAWVPLERARLMEPSLARPATKLARLGGGR